MSSTISHLSSLTIIFFFFAITITIIEARNCSCSNNLCCSKYGYCGTGIAYCGRGCQQGPCYSSLSTLNGGSGVRVSDVVTQSFFDAIVKQAGSSCAGKKFYSRSAFLDAVSSYSMFAGEGSPTVATREIAAAFAHFTYETGYFCYIDEIGGASRSFCAETTEQWPCNPSKSYHGRGPLMLTWNFNYGPAGKAIGFDGLNAPETVARDPVVAFKTGMWFWMNNVHSLIISNQGFGATIRAINGMECNGGNSAAVNARVGYYRQYCTQFGVSPGDNLTC